MNYIAIYSDFLKQFLNPQKSLKVVFDCSNGTAGIILKELFRKLKVKSKKFKVNVDFINNRPDGNFPAHGPDPTAEGAMRDLQNAVKRRKADLGVIFDADGDRVFFVDDEAKPVNADAAAILLGSHFRGPVVLTELSGYLAREIIGAKKKIFYSRVGHYFIKKLMRRRKADFGAEASGHYYFAFDAKSLSNSKRGRGKIYFDSGIIAALRMINAVSEIHPVRSKMPKASAVPLIAERTSNGMNGGLADKYFRSREINFSTAENIAELLKRMEKIYQKSAAKVSRLDGLKMEFNSSSKSAAWWFNLRPSGTERLARLNLEAKNLNTLEAKIRELTEIIKSS